MSVNNLEVSVASGDALDVRHVHRPAGDVSALQGDGDRGLAQPRRRLRRGDRQGGELHPQGRASGPHAWHGRLQPASPGRRRGERGSPPTSSPSSPRSGSPPSGATTACSSSSPSSTSCTKLLGEWGIEPDAAALRHLQEAQVPGAVRRERLRLHLAACSRTRASRSTSSRDGGETKLVLDDAPQTNDAAREPHPLPRPARPLGRPGARHRRHACSQRVRPGKYTLRDHDYRQPAGLPAPAPGRRRATASRSSSSASTTPRAPSSSRATGATARPPPTTGASTRSDEPRRPRRWPRRASTPSAARPRAATFDTNAIDLAPGHRPPHRSTTPAASSATAQAAPVLESRIARQLRRASCNSTARRVSADLPYHPPLKTPKPKAQGVESATVVGPAGRGDPHRRVRPRARAVPLGPRGQVRREQLLLDPREPALGRRRLRRHQPARASGRRCSSTSSAAIPTGR